MVRPALEGPLSRDMTMIAEVSLRLGTAEEEALGPRLGDLMVFGVHQAGQSPYWCLRPHSMGPEPHPRCLGCLGAGGGDEANPRKAGGRHMLNPRLLASLLSWELR